MVVRILLSILLIVVLAACNSEYDYETAINNGDVVDLHGNTKNIERLETFRHNIELDKKDEVRITRFTIEGDPIFYDLQYNSRDIKLTYDNSRDNYGTKNIRSTNCKSLNKSKNDSRIVYKFEGCYGKNEVLGTSFEFSYEPNSP